METLSGKWLYIHKFYFPISPIILICFNRALLSHIQLSNVSSAQKRPLTDSDAARAKLNEKGYLKVLLWLT